MHAAPFLLILLAALAGCGTEQSQPVPAPEVENWGKLGPDPDKDPGAANAGPKVAGPAKRPPKRFDQPPTSSRGA